MGINNRILVVDDDPEIIRTYLEVLRQGEDELSPLLRFSNPQEEKQCKNEAENLFSLAAVRQGEEAVALVQQALARGEPFAVAFIDVRMPPGIDGVETARLIRQIDNNINIIIISAYSDRTLDEMQEAVQHDLTFARKPLSNEEIMQLARNGCNSWQGDEALREQYGQMERRIEALAFSRWYRENELTALVDGLVTCTEKGLILLCNPAATQMVGKEVEELLYQPFALLLEGEQGEALLAAVLAGEPVHNPYLLRGSSSAVPRRVQISGHRLESEPGGERLVVFILEPLA